MKTLCLLLVLAATTIAFPRPAQAEINWQAHSDSVDPKLDWFVLETPHFHIVYDSKHYWLAQRYAGFAEQAYQGIQPVFKEAPAKTTIVINDHTDQSNGFSTQLPYPLIMTYPVLPTSHASLEDYGDWGLELITHEYTHTLNMEPVHGVMKPLSYVFGTLIKPNSLLPRWYLEGLAVEMETRYSHYGRLRSADYLSAGRAMVEEGTLRKEDISRVNESDIPDWPGGLRPYLLGSLMWNEIVKMEGDKAIYDLNQRYSRRIPGAINGPAIDILGMNWREVLDRTYTDLEKMANKQIAAISTKPRPKEQRVPQGEAFYSSASSISPDGSKLVYLNQTHNRNSIVEVIERKGRESFLNLKSKEIVDFDFYDSGIERLSWFPDSKRFAFDRLKPYKFYYYYSDIWVYDLDKHDVKRVTEGLRAHEPVVSRDGGWIAFVQNTDEGTQLSAVDADGKNFRVLYAPAKQVRISSPEFLSPNQIVFGEKSDNGKDFFKVINTQTKEVREVLQGYAPVHDPRATAKGLLFTSDRTGIANVYLWDPQGHVRAVSNSTTRLEYPELDPRTNELIYTRLNGKGAALAVVAESEWSKTAAEPPKVGSMVDYEWPHYDPPHVNFEAQKKTYSTWPYLLPRYWFPMFAFDGTGVIVGGSTSASDPLEKQAYVLDASYDSYVHQPAFYGEYVNNEINHLKISLYADEYYDAISTGGTDRGNTDALITAETTLDPLSDFITGGVGWMFSRTDLGGTPVTRNGPQAFVQFFAARKRGLEISPETGGGLRFAHTQFIPNYGDIGYAREDVSSQIFLSNHVWPLKWLPDRHVLMLSVNATLEPQLHSTALGVGSLSGYYQTETINTRYVMRGYDTGAFIGRNFINGTAEYRFPIKYFYSGFGTKPLFVRRLHGAVFTDVATLDGDYFDEHDNFYHRTKMGTQYFMGTGAELRADLTLVYQIPYTLGLGVYYGVNRQAGPGAPIPYVTLGL